MAATSGARERMVEGGRELIGRNGYRATSLREIWEYTGTPRGSVYFHFPGGKDELGLEVVALQAAIWIELVGRAVERTSTPAEFLHRLATGLVLTMTRSDYTAGCAIAAMSNEAASLAGPLREAVGAFYGAWTDAVAAGLEHHGMPAPRAVELARTAIPLLVGGLTVVKATRDASPLDQVGSSLGELAASHPG